MMFGQESTGTKDSRYACDCDIPETRGSSCLWSRSWTRCYTSTSHHPLFRHHVEYLQLTTLEHVRLAHIIWGAHDANFHALWQQLRDEHEQLARKGYTGEGFLSQGHKLGGRRIPMDEARRRARASAEKRKVLNGGSGQRLGGVPVRRGADIRKVIADAAQSRINVTKGCGSGAKDTKAIVEQATKNGFRTQAEEDDATERAIMEAYIEMLQEEEKEKWGEAYVPASASNPGGSVVATGGDARNVDRRQPPPATASTGKAVSSAPALPLSTKPAPPAVPAVSTTKNNTPKSSASTAADSWTCPTCTLQNPFNYLCCDACGLERPDALTSSFSNPSDNHRHSSSMKSQRHPASSLSSSLKSNTKKDREMDKKVSASRSTPAFWICHVCDTVMETQWWTCSSCGAMKLSS